MGKVSTERDCHTDQAVFMFLPKNAAVVLPPVNTLFSASAIASDGPSSSALSFKFLPAQQTKTSTC